MGLEVLGHAESLDFLLSEDGGHLGVGGEILLVVGVLKSNIRLVNLPQ